MNRSLVPMLALLVLLAAHGFPQEGARRPPRFVTPEIKDDRTIVLRLYAPQAKAVRLSSTDLPGSNPFGPGVEMKQGEQGVWETTVGPVPAGSYRYSFNVDGIAVIDPRNTTTSEAHTNLWSLLHVSGSAVSDVKDVPHGAVAQWQYFSKSLGRLRRVHVYTPSGYEAGTEKLPVLYLLHGAMDCDASWSTVGRAGAILDNLIAAGEARPMIVVMPMGHTGPFTFGPGDNLTRQMDEFEKDFENDLRPAVERRYRVSTERRHRAIAGLSMGGAQALNIALARLEDYGYVGVFSSGVFGIDQTGAGSSWEKQHRDALENAELRRGLRLVWIATGKEDFLLRTTQGTVRMLKNHGFEVTYRETDGGHTWINWRESYLPEFVRAVFREQGSAR